jgi:hypothetical protein
MGFLIPFWFSVVYKDLSLNWAAPIFRNPTAIPIAIALGAFPVGTGGLAFFAL